MIYVDVDDDDDDDGDNDDDDVGNDDVSFSSLFMKNSNPTNSGNCIHFLSEFHMVVKCYSC